MSANFAPPRAPRKTLPVAAASRPGHTVQENGASQWALAGDASRHPLIVLLPEFFVGDDENDAMAAGDRAEAAYIGIGEPARARVTAPSAGLSRGTLLAHAAGGVLDEGSTGNLAVAILEQDVAGDATVIAKVRGHAGVIA